MARPPYDRENIDAAIQVLFEPGSVVELRVPVRPGRSISGYYDDFKKLADAIQELSGTYAGVYYTLNPVDRALLSRRCNRYEDYAKTTTSGDNIVKRRRLLIDMDAVRPAEISSSAAEKAASKAMCAAIRKYLASLGWPEPIVCDSGNGYHLLYLIDLPNDDAAKELVENVLKALAAKFDNDVVHVDKTVYDPSRIVKAYGSLARKGDHTQERPHRLARMFQPPATFTVVQRELLEALAAEAPQDKKKAAPKDGSKKGPWTQELTEALLLHGGIEHGAAMNYKGGFKWQHDCLNDSNHHKPDAFTQLDAEGWISEKCSHNSCGAGLNSVELVNKIDELAGKPFPRPQAERTAVDMAWADIDDEDEPATVTPGGDDAAVTTPSKARRTWNELAAMLDELRVEYTIGDNGKKQAVPEHIVGERVIQFVLKALKTRAKMIIDGYPFVFLTEEGEVFNLANDEDAHRLLSKLRLRVKQKHCGLVRENLFLHILMHGDHTPISKFGATAPNGDIFVNNGRGGMYRISEAGIEEVANGTDGIVMLNRGHDAWPELTPENLKRIEQLRSLGGLKVGEGKLSQHFDACFQEGNLNHAQQLQLVMCKWLGMFLGLELKPIMLSIGEQGSGKSTLNDKQMRLLYGMRYESGRLPHTMRSLIAAVTTNGAVSYDNIDGVNFNSKQGDYSTYPDVFCKCSTGGTESIAVLYQTNVERQYHMSCEQFMTARLNPIPSHRSDVLRRTLVFSFEPPEQPKSVAEIKREFAADLEEMRLETLARLMGIRQALLAVRDSEWGMGLTQMADFEAYTMRAAQHEGWQPEMTAIWQGTMGEYRERVSEHSQTVAWVRKFIGSPGFVSGYPYRAGQIHKALRIAYAESFTRYVGNETSLGVQLAANLSSLRQLGYEVKSSRGSKTHTFTVEVGVVGVCQKEYHDTARGTWVGDDDLLETVGDAIL